jgi:hypothetical protein
MATGEGLLMTDDEISDLKRELAEVKAAMKPLDPSALEREAKEWASEMHALSEARMSNAGAFTLEELRAFEAAAPRSVVQDLVAHGTIPGPSGAGTSGTITKVSSSPGLPGSNTGGWRDATPIGPPPGIAQADQLMDAADKADRIELAQRLARRRGRNA